MKNAESLDNDVADVIGRAIDRLGGAAEGLWPLILERVVFVEIAELALCLVLWVPLVVAWRLSSRLSDRVELFDIMSSRATAKTAVGIFAVALFAFTLGNAVDVVSTLLWPEVHAAHWLTSLIK